MDESNKKVDPKPDDGSETASTVPDLGAVAAEFLEGSKLKDVLEFVQRINEARTKAQADLNEKRLDLELERLGHSSDLAKRQWTIRFITIIVTIAAFSAGAWLFRTDAEIVRLIIVSFVSFLGGTAIATVPGGVAKAREQRSRR